MKKEIYLINSIESIDFKDAAKEKTKLNKMIYKQGVIANYAVTNKKEAIKDCRQCNRNDKIGLIYFWTKLNLYK